MARGPTGTGPHQRRLALGEVDPDTPIGQYILEQRRHLTKQLGGPPLGHAQFILVDGIAWLRLHVTMFNEQVAQRGKPMTDIDRRQYLAFVNSLARSCRLMFEVLDYAAKTTASPVYRNGKNGHAEHSLTDILRERQARQAAAE